MKNSCNMSGTFHREDTEALLPKQNWLSRSLLPSLCVTLLNKWCDALSVVSKTSGTIFKRKGGKAWTAVMKNIGLLLQKQSKSWTKKITLSCPPYICWQRNIHFGWRQSIKSDKTKSDLTQSSFKTAQRMPTLYSAVQRIYISAQNILP